MAEIDLSKLSKTDIKALSDAGVLGALLKGEKNDVGASVPPLRQVYAPRTDDGDYGGIFTRPGVRPEMFSAMSQPLDLLDIVQPTRSVFHETRIEILTGQTETVGDNPADFCGEPVTPGQLKKMGQYIRFGEIHIGSDKIDINRAGMRSTRAVSERTIRNRAASDPFIPSILQNPNINFFSEESQMMYQVGTALRRALAPVNIVGDITKAYTATEKGFIKEYNGIDKFIKTGYTDIDSGQLAPAADSIVKTWGAPLSSTVNGQNIVTAVTTMVHGRLARARQVGMAGGVTWAFLIHPDAWYELTSQWACSYVTDRCGAGSVGQPLQQNLAQINEMRLAMMNGQYLLVDGVQYPVVFSEGIPLEAGGGNYRKTDLYFMPISFEGERLLKFEFFPMDNPSRLQLASHFNQESVVLNNGMFAVYWERTKSCVQMILDAMFRLWHDTPFLCARLDDLLYVSQTNYNSPFVSGTGYVDGGVSSVLRSLT